MFKLILLTLSLLTVNQAYAKDIFSFKLSSTKGEVLNLSDYKGKALLIVNIATRCGYTGQLDDLETLNKSYSSKGLVVIGVPSNDFASQSPGSDEEVAKFCRLKYGVTFPLTKKSIVSGNKKIELIKYITRVSGGNEIKWNFEKFLFNKEGKFVSRHLSSVEPLGSKLENEIKSILK